MTPSIYGFLRKCLLPVGYGVCGGLLGWRALVGLIVASILVGVYLATDDR